MIIIQKSYDELKEAEFYLAKMQTSKSLSEFEAAWKNYLSRLERIWNKFLAAHKGHSKWDGWGGSHIRVRKQDPLLSYLTNARGADEHTVSEITEKSSDSIAINPAHGNSLYIKKMEMGYINGNLAITKLDASQPLKITFTPATIRLLPVINRGKKYDVPTSHLGNPINPKDIVTIANLGVEYYRKLLEDSKTIFVEK